MRDSARMVYNYDPLKDQDYMSADMQNYFKNKLNSELQSLLKKEPEFCRTMKEDSLKESDFVDQSSIEELRFNYFVHHEHEVHNRHEIEAALQRLTDGSYGYCAATGRPIGVNRMVAAPYATYCIDVQSELESNYRRYATYGRTQTVAYF
ncbi:MAG: TraR/DksA C4-type zinc finger protein [Alphaproteobacteria bacterium]